MLLLLAPIFHTNIKILLFRNVQFVGEVEGDSCLVFYVSLQYSYVDIFKKLPNYIYMFGNFDIVNFGEFGIL